ncbi:AmiS/UreI family transporter [Domibacillus epiphyticus]|uniref:Transporter n=1 Tax=Domibacillus epiphyticus TaxID=1714355 RepID=A0A1V2AAM2_9BACI|nr:AmiS/UreI family transporter [Domibacillus epiphyticus]OMP68045.1 transporter [Domibacillus epiphyticus]
MSNVGLLYVGAVLFINGLMLIGKVEPKSAGIFNLFVGALQVFTPLFLIITAEGDNWSIFQASGIFLFGFTYLYVGIANLMNADSSGIGYYSLWVSILAVGYSLVNFIHFQEFKFGVIWLFWSFLWALFYLLLAKKKEIAVFTGWVAIIQSWVTAAIPAFLSLIGYWQHVSFFAACTVFVSVIVLFLLIYITQHHSVKKMKLS